MKRKYYILSKEPLWYKNAIIYELHVKCFHDSNGDGIGDFKGLTQKLDYLENLGIDTIWLLPFYPSPLKDDGYDIADYSNIHPAYGNLDDFREFLRSAHQRGMRVITELILNHTSDQHPWFQKSRQAKPGSKWRNFYVWSKTPNKYEDARIIFFDFETSNWTWDPTAQAYYWHRFYSHQPDLNYDSPQVQKEILKVLDFWLKMGVDGFRLDAVPYLFEREGTLCENLPETHDFIKKLRLYVEANYPGSVLIGEANQWPEDAASYFGKGDECQIVFHFPLMPRLFMGLWMEDTFPISDILMQTPIPPEHCQWALFLRNHDELTLEMVTDEERDYMYSVFAKDPKARINLGIRRRLAPLLENHRARIELMNILLFSLPGTPIIYYGDEIGMGDNYYLGDRDGVRTPMQWSNDRNAGFSKCNPQELYLPLIIDPQYHHETVNVENLEKNLSSLLWWMRRIILFRHRHKAFGLGNFKSVLGNNSKVLSFIRQYDDETLLVVINLSRFAQSVELNMADFSGYTPCEVFSQNKFPVIHDGIYKLTLNSFGYYWFFLEKEKEYKTAEQVAKPFEYIVQKDWLEIFQGFNKKRLEKEILPRFLQRSSWFLGKNKVMRLVSIKRRYSFAGSEILILEISYSDSTTELYLLPVLYIEKTKAGSLMVEQPESIISSLHVGEEEGLFYDALYNEDFRKNLLQLFSSRKTNIFEGVRTQAIGKNLTAYVSKILKGDQRNAAISFNEKFFMKIYRKLEESENPECELSEKLTEVEFPNTPNFLGSLELTLGSVGKTTMGLLQQYVPHQDTAMTYAHDNVLHFFERVLAKKDLLKNELAYAPNYMDYKAEGFDPLLLELIGLPFLESVRLLGRRVAELHLALSNLKGKSFAPEPFTKDYQRSRLHALNNSLRRNFNIIMEKMKSVEKLDELDFILQNKDKAYSAIKKMIEKKFSISKFRIHGDLNLQDILFTGKDFVIIDFEGESDRPFSERRIKRSVFPDLAGVVYSIHDAIFTTLAKNPTLRDEDKIFLNSWAYFWQNVITGTFLKSYIEVATTVNKHSIIPEDSKEFAVLLNIFLVERGVKSLACEILNHPDRIGVPLKFLYDMLEKL